MSFKDNMYDRFVRRNENVRYEYERYVLDHIEEHERNRSKHWLVLLRLNWHYCIIKSTSPLIYKNNNLFELNDREIILIEDENNIENVLSNVENEGGWVLSEDDNNEENVLSEAKNNGEGVFLEDKNKEDVFLTEFENEKRATAYSFAFGLKDYDVISFDIFDTLILRNLNEPDHLFMIIGEKLNIYNFLNLRKKAEKEVREINIVTNGTNECTIYEIYDRIAYWTGIDPKIGVAAEFETELDFCVANPYMMQIYQIVEGMGKELYVTSNMYLPKPLMSQLLQKCGYTHFKDILVSCDYYSSKTNGALFEILKKKTEGKRIVHIGDNIKTDIQGAKAAKIDSRHYQTCRAIGTKYRARGFSSLIGSAYYAVVNNKLHNGTLVNLNHSMQWEFGYLYSGIIALGYVNWIHEKALHEGIQKVVFLSRDGAILKEVYDLLYCDIPSCYFLWSRLAALRTMHDGVQEQILSRVFIENAGKGYILRDLFDMLGWNCYEGALANALNDTHIDADWILNQENCGIVKNMLVDHWEDLKYEYAQYRQISANYIKNIIGKTEKILLVDLGWTGKNTNVLKDFIISSDIGVNNIKICMLGSVIRQEDPVKFLSKDISCYIFDSGHNREIHDLFKKNQNGTINILEEQFSSSSCSFAGFNSSKDYIFSPPEIENYDFYDEIKRGIIDFCLDYYESFKKYPYMMNLSGYDAFVPLKFILKNKKYINYLFGKLTYEKGICPNSNGRDFVSLTLR